MREADIGAPLANRRLLDELDRAGRRSQSYLREIAVPPSHNINMASRWAVEIEGHHATISRLESLLNSSLQQESDTFISRLSEVAVVRSRLWNNVDDVSFVEQLAQTELAFMQGLTKLAGGASPLGVGTMFELGPGDTIIKQIRQSTNSIYVLSRDVDTTPVFRRRMDVTRQHDALRGVVIELSGLSDWIKVYKAVEYLEEHFGGERQLQEAFPTKKAALKRIKRTAQSVRHRARAFETIDFPYKLEDAEKFLKVLLDEIISSIELPSTVPSNQSYNVTKRDYPAGQVVGLKPLILVNGERSDVAFVGDTLTAV